MKKLIFLIIFLVIVAAAGYWQYQKYLENPERKINRIVNNVSLRVTEALLYEIEDSIEKSKISYKDLFEKLEIHYAQINSDISEVQKIVPAKNISREKINRVMKYLQISQQLLTAEYEKYKQNMEYTDLLKTVRIQATGVGVSGDIYGKKVEYEKAKTELVKAVIKLSEAHSMAAEVISKDNLVERQIIDKAIGKFSKKWTDILPRVREVGLDLAEEMLLDFLFPQNAIDSSKESSILAVLIATNNGYSSLPQETPSHGGRSRDQASYVSRAYFCWPSEASSRIPAHPLDALPNPALQRFLSARCWAW